MAKHDDDNRSNQMNPNNDAYRSSRGLDDHSEDSENRTTSVPQSRGDFNQGGRNAQTDKSRGKDGRDGNK